MENTVSAFGVSAILERKDPIVAAQHDKLWDQFYENVKKLGASPRFKGLSLVFEDRMTLDIEVADGT